MRHAIYIQPQSHANHRLSTPHFFSFFDHNVMVTSREIIDYLFNATNILTFEARNNYKMEIRKRS